MRPRSLAIGTMSRILRHIAGVRFNVIFTTRDCLNYGTRASVDKVLSRLVKRQVIIRIAWGVFMRAGSKIPDIEVIASAKARAFGKEIALHVSEAAKQVQLQTRTVFQTKAYFDSAICKDVRAKNEVRIAFAVNGRTSSFVSQNIRVHLIGVSSRKMQLSASKAGRALLALMQLGKEGCTKEHVLAVQWLLSGSDVQEIKKSGALMPAWLARNWICNH